MNRFAKNLITIIILGASLPAGFVVAQTTATTTAAPTSTPILVRGEEPTTTTTTITTAISAPVAALPQPNPNVFTFTYQKQTFPIDEETLNSWQGAQELSLSSLLEPPPVGLRESLLRSVGQNVKTQTQAQMFNFRLDAIYAFLESIAGKINLPSQEPKLTIVDGKATDFVAPQTGTSLDVYQSSLNTLSALQAGKNKLELEVYQTPPQTSLSDINNLGISELVAEGTSKFNGSPKNRRFNIAVGVEKMKGIILPQGAEFSFDDNLGPVDGEHGFLPELVIKGNNTLPEFGGGLCQVSTTAFRAAMDAGLPITARRNHAYAVQYYSPQGTDATIYPGSADLRFVNNTPGAILIWPYLKDKDTLIFDFYGTKDGREVTLEKPIQYDRKSDSSMKASWTRIVTLNGETSTSTFKSVYQPPALFHHTESFVSTSTKPSGLKMQ